MCVICVELRKDKLSSAEARQNLGEMHNAMSKEHIHEVLRLIWKKEDSEYAEEYNFFDNYGDTD